MKFIPIAILSTDFPLIMQAADLLKRLEGASLPCGQPSDYMLAFLDWIENANANSPDISNDDNDASWGHFQFMASSLMCKSVLLLWSNVGSISFACQLITAVIKTSRVAWHLCHSKQLKPTSFLSDIYLSNIVKLLWGLCKDTEQGVSWFKYDLLSATDSINYIYCSHLQQQTKVQRPHTPLHPTIP